MQQSSKLGHIWFLGDCHGSISHVLTMLESVVRRPAAVVFLGDMEMRLPFDQVVAPIEEMGVEVWFIHGNHDTDTPEIYRCLFESAYKSRNLHGRVVEVAGLRVAGLGGVFRGSVWYPRVSCDEISYFNGYADFVASQRRLWPQRIRADEAQYLSRGKFLQHRSTIFKNDWASLAAKRADILVTHEAPSCHPHGFVAIDQLARCLGVQSSFHGHHHDCLDYKVMNDVLKFCPYGVGLRGISDIEGNVILAGE